ncbi:MAG: hypothetical protein IKD75_11870 [Prevotella sp.]|nr:hypothetical protein [Prevotella sp.]
MQKISKYMMMAALALVGTIATGCTSEELANDAPQAKNDNNTVTLTTTISLDGSASTRALDAQGKKTFAAGDQVAIYYKNTSGETQYADSKPLTANDITNNGKTAKITVTLDNPKAGGQLRYVYPAAMANSDIAPNEDINDENTFSTEGIQYSQDGTLEKLAKNFDLAIYDGNLTSDAKLPASATLKNKLAIAELTIKDYAGTDITSNITKLVVQQGNGLYGYELTRPDNAVGPIYVALYPTPGSNKENITVTATANDDTKYEKDFKFTFAANNIYPIAVKTFKVVDVSTLTIPDGGTHIEYTAQNGDMLTGTIANRVLISIAANANVALKNLTIDYEAPGSNFNFHEPGITCIGNATIILEGTNKVKAFEGDFPGIRAATNSSNNDYTLTIKGDGSLEAIGQMGGAGIGGGIGGNCGNIVIESGSITATGGNGAAGIGSGKAGICGNITITGGDITATGGAEAAGIGTGYSEDGEYSKCGSITITNGVKEVIAKKGINADCSIGKGNGNNSCGKVTILGFEYWNGSGYVNDEGHFYLQAPDLKIIP